MSNTTLIPVLEAARQLGVTPTTLAKRLDRAGVATQLNPLDRRYRLIPRDALPLLTKPLGARPGTSEPAESSSVSS